MGSNENFPPPPPPGQPPQPANWPPQQPGFQPTQQVPATQAYPQQGYAPAVAPAPAPKKGNGLLIGGGLVVAAALIGGVVLLTGGDDKKSTTITLAPITSTTAATIDTTIATTAAITVPVTVAPTVPETTADSGLVTITDDTGTFSIVLPNDLELDTTTITSTDDPPVVIPSISAADVIADYNVDDTTFGLTAVSVGPDIGSDAAQVMAFLEPADGTCTGRVQEEGIATAVGIATRVSLTGCGAGGGNKVLMVVQLADRPVVIGIYMQGLAAIENLQPAAQYALESIFVF